MARLWPGCSFFGGLVQTGYAHSAHWTRQIRIALEFGRSIERSASANAPVLPGGIQPSFGPLFEHGPLEFRKSPDHLHHHAAGRSGGVDGLGQAAKSGFGLRQPATDPQRQQWSGSYVHSKTHVYDDECAIIGSANADDRGYTFDSEIVACITEDPSGRMARTSHFARDLRIALWHKHLGVSHAKLADWAKGLQF
jgi:phosphatidylserine/phosphatidylglycerophosphate/cardiolipin synthase-like enzyme